MPACATAYACVSSRSTPLERESAMIDAMKPIMSADRSIMIISTSISAMPRSCSTLVRIRRIVLRSDS